MRSALRFRLTASILPRARPVSSGRIETWLYDSGRPKAVCLVQKKRTFNTRARRPHSRYYAALRLEFALSP